MAAKIQGADLHYDVNIAIGESGTPKTLDVWGNAEHKANTILKNLVVDIDVLAVDETGDTVKAKGLRVIDDEGTGEASTLQLTNIAEETVSTGVGSIKLTGTGTTQDSAGFIKAYVGTTVVYIPYFTNHAGV